MNVMSAGQFRGQKIYKSLSFDLIENPFGHFLQVPERNVFTKGIRNRGKSGHGITVAQK